MSSSKQNPRDKQPGHTGKVENDSNKMGEQPATPHGRARGGAPIIAHILCLRGL